jgi:hypothetical protein
MDKFEALWIGPFKISEVFSNNTYRLQDLEGEEVFNSPVNGHFPKKCFVLSLHMAPLFVNIVLLFFLFLFLLFRLSK